MAAEHSLETRIALLELQVVNLNTAVEKMALALADHMTQEVEAMKSLQAEIQKLQRSDWVVSNMERLGWILVTAGVSIVAAWIAGG
jgi:ribosomal silencing factor RsfS